MKSAPRKSPDAADKPISCAGYRFPPEVISYAVWLYFRFPLSLRMVEELLAKWHLDEVMVTINGRRHWLWRAVDQHGETLDVLVQSRRDRHAARHLQRFASTHDQVANLFMRSRDNRDAAAKRAARAQAFAARGRASGARTIGVTAV